jgi:D-3-phosphoglycerate dehydrogenase
MKKVLAASVSFCSFSMNHEPGVILKNAGVTVDVNQKGKAFTEAELLEIIDQYDGIIVGTDPMTPYVIKQGKKLKIIAKNGVGFDNINLEAATDQNVFVTITPGAVEQTVADTTFGLIFSLARNITRGEAAIRKGEWPRLIGINVSYKKLGVIGLGRIGKNVIMRSTGFNMKVYAYDPQPDKAFCEKYGVELVDMETLLQASDIVSIHAPLMDSTRHLINEHTLSLMQPGALLINTSRGGLVDEKALIKALREKNIAGAALDVFEKEPLEKDSPLLELENVILTPHLAGMSSDALIASGKMIAESITLAFAGQTPQHVVNKDLLIKMENM